MKQYNIYAGLTGSFGNAKYQYTNLYETIEEATEDAFQEACEIYEQYEGHLYTWQDAIRDYCTDNNIKDIDDEDNMEIEEYYNENREDWLAYYAIPTDEDNVEELILGYSNDSSSQTDCL